MALGGGTFLTQNKTLPGSYLNFVSASRASATLAERGVATMPLSLGWGPEGEIMSVTAEAFQKDSLKLLGYPYTHEKMKGLRDLFRNIKQAYLYRLNAGGTAAANDYIGALLPIEYVPGLETARLTEILIPAQEEEDTERLRKRYYASLEAQAFGGNVADYLDKCGKIPGVGGLKVYREWNGGVKPAELAPPEELADWLDGLSDAPEAVSAWLAAVSAATADGLLTVGGSVRLVLIDDKWAAPSDELTRRVQEAVDPERAHAEGLGLAPIGHFVTVRGVEAADVDIATTLSYQAGWSWEAVKPYAEAAVDGYLLELSKAWADQAEPLVVRVSGIEANLLSCPGVVDVGGTTVNGGARNLVLGANQIPVRRELRG